MICTTPGRFKQALREMINNFPSKIESGNGREWLGAYEQNASFVAMLLHEQR
jgi:hypothetical protein